MYRIIYFIVNLLTKLHQKIFAINAAHGSHFTDKQLHFLIIGIFGFFMLLVMQPIFTWLTKKGGILLITFLYVMTIVVVVSFAIEIGQAFTGIGTMDFYDIASGMLGFFVFCAIYLLGYIIYKSIEPKIKEYLKH